MLHKDFISSSLIFQDVEFLKVIFKTENNFLGEFISLGINEQDDVEAVISYLRSVDKVSKIAL